MCDCTYVYLEHSGNLNFQHSTFSSHKKRNLFKFLVWVYPNGTVALISGPYGSDDDNGIICEVLEKEEAPEELVATNREIGL